MKKSKDMSILEKIGILLVFIVIIFIGIYVGYENEKIPISREVIPEISYELSNIPEYKGKAYIVINENNPKFSEEDTKIDEYYSNIENERVRNGYDKN